MLANKTSKKHQQGASLIEVLVAVIVLGVGLLGLAGLQVSAMQNSQSSYLSSQAALMAYNIIDQARANGGRLNAADIAEWNALVSTLPGGSGEAEIAAGRITVSVSWIDAHWREAPAEVVDAGDGDGGGDDETEVVTAPDTRISTFSMSSAL